MFEFRRANGPFLSFLPQFLQVNSRIVPQIKQRSLPFRNHPIHYSQIVLQAMLQAYSVKRRVVLTYKHRQGLIKLRRGSGEKKVWGLDPIPKVLQYIRTYNKRLKIALLITY
jgi:hypothetical protein